MTIKIIIIIIILLVQLVCIGIDGAFGTHEINKKMY